jgi:hypothetical protein
MMWQNPAGTILIALSSLRLEPGVEIIAGATV